MGNAQIDPAFFYLGLPLSSNVPPQILLVFAFLGESSSTPPSSRFEPGQERDVASRFPKILCRTYEMKTGQRTVKREIFQIHLTYQSTSPRSSSPLSSSLPLPSFEGVPEHFPGSNCQLWPAPPLKQSIKQSIITVLCHHHLVRLPY